jgi:hypothetical protein
VLVRVAAVATLPAPTDAELHPAALARLDADPELSLGVDCCGVCALPEASMGSALVECAACRAVVYCGDKHRVSATLNPKP